MSKLNEQFNEQFSDYIYNDIMLIGVETACNYIPLRNHVISVQMLENDELYNQLSQSEKFDWKNNFLTPEQEQEHICIMSSQFQQKCYDWINNDDNTELSNEMTLTFGEEETTYLFDSYILNIWKQFVGDCMSVKVK
jgi:hypothetical protein